MKTFASLAAGVAAIAAVPALAQMAQPRMAMGARAAMTRAQAEAQVAPMFAMFDANRDGFVTKAEARTRMMAMRAQRQGMRAERQGGSAQSNDAHFNEMDRDRNGSISRAEFDAHHTAGMGGARENRAERREDRMERRAERMQRRGMRGAAGMRLGGRNFDRVDANRDGRLSLAEARVAHLAMFTAADANRDGTVTREERRNSRQQMRAARQQRRAG